MDVFFWYPEKSELTSEGSCTRVHRTSNFLQVQEKHGHVLPVTLYLSYCYHQLNISITLTKKVFSGSGQYCILIG